MTTTDLMVCSRCGADNRNGAPLSACTEKRGEGPPWRHDFRPPESRPFIGDDLDELSARIHYLTTKTTGSLATAVAFRALEDERTYRLASDLYTEKATKRATLLHWTVRELMHRVLDLEED